MPLVDHLGLDHFGNLLHLLDDEEIASAQSGRSLQRCCRLDRPPPFGTRNDPVIHVARTELRDGDVAPRGPGQSAADGDLAGLVSTSASYIRHDVDARHGRFEAECASARRMERRSCRFESNRKSHASSPRPHGCAKTPSGTNIESHQEQRRSNGKARRSDQGEGP